MFLPVSLSLGSLARSLSLACALAQSPAVEDVGGEEPEDEGGDGHERQGAPAAEGKGEWVMGRRCKCGWEFILVGIHDAIGLGILNMRSILRVRSSAVEYQALGSGRQCE